MNEHNELSTLMQLYGSDKYGGHHNYTTLYHEIFCGIKTEVKNLLEVGIGTKNPSIKSNMAGFRSSKPGGSLRAWRDYFVNAQVYGLDIDKDILFNEERIKTFYCDQTNKDDIANFLNSEHIKNLEFDIIIDDGLHTYDANYCFLINSFYKLKPGGIYFVEDVRRNTEQSFKDQQQKLKDMLSFSEFDMHEIPHPRNNGDNRLLVIKK